MQYFNSCKSEECFSELLITAEFFFAIPSHNANNERVFSLMQSQWRKERNKLLVESVKGILFLQHNFKYMSCKDFYEYIGSQPKLLRAIRSSNKYPSTQHSAACVLGHFINDTWPARPGRFIGLFGRVFSGRAKFLARPTVHRTT